MSGENGNINNIPAKLGITDISMDEEELELKKNMLADLKIQVEIETEINRLELRRTLSTKEKLILNAITEDKLANESSKSLSEAFMSFIKAGQLLEGKPTEINRQEFSNMTDAELDMEEARITMLLSTYSNKSEDVPKALEEDFVLELMKENKPDF